MKRFSYTRKYTSKQKLNPKNDPELALHRIINRIDSEKDAYYCDIPVGKNHSIFKTIADKLFGALPKEDYKKSLSYLETTMKSYEAIDNNEIVVDTYNEKIYQDILPDYISYGIQDAGLSPKRYGTYIQILATPGSYVDPAKRSSPEVYLGFDKIISHSDFIKIGMIDIFEMISKLNADKSCTISIQYNNADKTITQFSNDFKPIYGDIDFFKGNSTKNRYIDMDDSNPNTIGKLILCKELGDTTQALFGKICTNEIIEGNKKICLFTNDNILTIRCKLLQLQVVYNVICGKAQKTIYHYPIMSEVTESFIKMWKKNVQSHNEFVIKSIQDIIKKGIYSLVNGHEISFIHNNAVKSILNNYMKMTANNTEQFLKLSTKDLKLETYRRLSMTHFVPRLFFDNVLNSAALSLPFFTEADRSTLMNKTSTIGMKGGAKVPEFNFAIPEDDYTVERVYTDDDIPSVKTKHVLYNLIYDTYKDKDIVCYIVEGISSVLATYFGYIGASSFDEIFLKYIVDAYNKNILGNIPFDSFEYLFNSYHNELSLNNAQNKIEPNTMEISELPTFSVSRTVEPVRRRNTRRKSRVIKE